MYDYKVKRYGDPDSADTLTNEKTDPGVFGSDKIYPDISAEVKSDSGADVDASSTYDSTTQYTGVLYSPGNEPEKIRKRIDRLFEKLDSAYPDKVVTRLHVDHKKWGETVTELYRLLGYPNGNAFLNAYGYTTVSALDKTEEYERILNELKKRYADGPECKTVSQLAQMNPDLSLRSQSLYTYVEKTYGLTLAKFLIREGVIKAKSGQDYYEQANNEFEKLKNRYLGIPYIGTVTDLHYDNSDLDWNAINSYYLRSGTKETFKSFLVSEGIIAERENKLDEIIEVLKKRYPEENKFTGSFDGLKQDNSDIPGINYIETWTRRFYKIGAKEYLIQQGIMEREKTPEEKLADITRTLQERYAGGRKIAYYLADVKAQNRDLPIGTIGTWTKKIYGMNASEYLICQGIITTWFDQYVLEREKKIAEALSSADSSF